MSTGAPPGASLTEALNPIRGVLRLRGQGDTPLSEFTQWHIIKTCRDSSGPMYRSYAISWKNSPDS